jgi:hypothetical protein
MALWVYLSQHSAMRIFFMTGPFLKYFEVISLPISMLLVMKVYELPRGDEDVVDLSSIKLHTV